jgi:predicted adenylyl cyclase CyaB
VRPDLTADRVPARQEPSAIASADSGGGRNVELKATDPSQEASIEACRKLGAVDCGVLWQQDTYFGAPDGRLKLREQRPGRSQLIHYVREDEPEQRESRYQILDILDVGPLRNLLAAGLGVRATVTKRRRLFLWRSVRIHLDDVEGLGTFIELEAVAQAESDLSEEHRLIDELRARLSITDDRILPDSYADQQARLSER